jgi:uncharacterized damage-inducible protein DinB
MRSRYVQTIITETWNAQPSFDFDRLSNVRTSYESLTACSSSSRFFSSWPNLAPTVAFWEMLQHVVNHGSYHRGQITTMLRQLGAKPPQYMDMIVFYRERQNKS